VEGLTKQMQDSGASVCSIRGDMQPLERAANMEEFHRGASRLLITTDAWCRVITSDVWSGGIDFKRVKVVINYDLPSCREMFVERFGTSSRFDSRRVAISLVTDEEMPALRDLEMHFSTTVRFCSLARCSCRHQLHVLCCVLSLQSF
jgi:superfamily II DNA/RNA helicase